MLCGNRFSPSGFITEEKITSCCRTRRQKHTLSLRDTLQLHNHNQVRLEHFKDKHVFSCGLIKLKVNASDAEVAPELPGNYRAVKEGNEKGRGGREAE